MNAVPEHYRGVWVRTLLKTPQQRDDSTFVRWMQTSQWHADLRLPATDLPADTLLRLAGRQGFCGVTEVTQETGTEICTWHRRSDFQPPRGEPDAGVMVFETLDRVIETGLHAPYREVWDRLPNSTGRYIVLAGLDASGEQTEARVLVAGDYCMQVRPRPVAWPEDLVAGQSLAEVVRSHPALARELLDFEISFGRLEAGLWTIEGSTLPGQAGNCMPLAVHRTGLQRAEMHRGSSSALWRILEWSCDASRL